MSHLRSKSHSSTAKGLFGGRYAQHELHDRLSLSRGCLLCYANANEGSVIRRGSAVPQRILCFGQPHEVLIALLVAAEKHSISMLECQSFIPGHALCLVHLPDRLPCLCSHDRHGQLFERYRLCPDLRAGAVVGPSLDLLSHPGRVGI